MGPFSFRGRSADQQPDDEAVAGILTPSEHAVPDPEWSGALRAALMKQLTDQQGSEPFTTGGSLVMPAVTVGHVTFSDLLTHDPDEAQRIAAVIVGIVASAEATRTGAE